MFVFINEQKKLVEVACLIFICKSVRGVRFLININVAHKLHLNAISKFFKNVPCGNGIPFESLNKSFTS